MEWANRLCPTSAVRAEWFGKLLVALTTAGSLALAPGAIAGELESRQQLDDSFRRAYERREWGEAIRAGTLLAEAMPGAAGPAYNLACVHALHGAPTEAARWLAAAASRGFSGAHLAATDPDLASLEGRPDYERALEAIRENRRVQFAAFRERAEAIEPLVVLPPGHDPSRAAPLIVALHGHGSTGIAIAAAWREVAAAEGAILVAPDAVRRAGEGFDWRFVDEAEWLVLRTVDHVAERYAVDRSRIVLTGFSQGANVTLRSGMRHAERFCGLVPISGHYEPHVVELPSGDEGHRPRVALLIGGDDPFVATYRDARRDLKRAGLDVRLEIVPGVGHFLPPDHHKRIRRALRFACRRSLSE